MDTREAPALLPALGLLAGTCLAAQLVVLPRPACVLLAALGLALRRPAGRFVACLALGLLNASLQWLEPRDALRALRPERPVEIVARTSGHPLTRDDDVLLLVRTRHLAQRRQLATAEIDVYVTLPPGIEPPPLGTTVRLKGYLRRSPGYANAPEARAGPWRLRLKSAHFLQVEEPPGRVMALAGRLRQRAEAALNAVGRRMEPDEDEKGDEDEEEGWSGAGLPLVRALLLGDRGQLPMAWQQALRRLGLAHLLAVSGLHVGLLAVLALLLARPLPRRARLLVTLAVIALYLLLIGPRPAVLRASIMGLLALGALLFQRPPQTLNALACCVFVLVLEKPSVVLELGFQLSFAATAGIVVLSPFYDARWRLPAPLRRAVAASFAAQVATLPLILPYTGGCHPLAVALNLVAIPWLGLFLLAAFPWFVLALVSVPAAAVLVPVLDALAAPLMALARLPPTAADLRLLALAPPAAWAVAVALTAAAAWPRRAATGLLGLALLAFTGAAPATSPAPATLEVLDVGQGDAILLTDGPRAALVDGGGWPRGDFGGRVLLPALAAAGVRRLDAVLLTHPDLDHCGGLADVVRYLPVGAIRTGPDVATEASCLARLRAAPGPRWRVVQRGDVLRLGRWRLSVLHPAAGDRGAENDLSLVIMAEIGQRRALLAGDVEAAAERSLVRRLGDELRADVLKVAHHGSKSSTTSAWLAAVAPRLALISAGVNNPYGHPAPPVLDRLAGAGVRVLRTDLAGRIRLTFHDDGRILIATPAAPRW